MHNGSDVDARVVELEKKIDERVTRDTCVTRAGECRRLDVYRGEPLP